MAVPESQGAGMSPQSKSPVFIGVLIVVILIGVVSYAAYRNSVNDGTSVEPGTNTTTTVPTTPAVLTTFKDGTYTAKGTYMVHAGPEEVTITVTLKDGVITDTQFQGTPNLPMSQRYMDAFSANYKPMVIGKDIKDLRLGKVSTSSLTPMGFNNALEQIKAQAAT